MFVIAAVAMHFTSSALFTDVKFYICMHFTAKLEIGTIISVRLSVYTIIDRQKRKYLKSFNTGLVSENYV